MVGCVGVACGSSSSEPAGAETDTDAIEDPECPELVYEGALTPKSVAELEAYPPYTRVTDVISLRDVPELESLEVFACLRSAKGITIWGTRQLRTLEGLERLEETENLNVFENDALESLDALHSLRRVDSGIHIVDNPALHTLGMRALEEVTGITIGDARAPDPDGETWYDPINSTGPLFECAPNAGHPSLTRIDGFDSLKGFWMFRILGNENLSSIDALRPIVERAYPLPIEGELEDNAWVWFEENPKLSIGTIEDIWSTVGPDGARFGGCGNAGEETCVCGGSGP